MHLSPCPKLMTKYCRAGNNERSCPNGDENTPLQSRDCQLHLKHEKGSDLPHLKMASHASL